MTGNINTRVLIPFADDDASGLNGFGLTLQLDPDFSTIGLGTRRLRLYPAIPGVTVRASIGEAIKGPTHGEQIENENILFSGSNAASPRRPIINLASLTSYGATFDRDGNTINPSFSIKNGQVVASEPEVYGGVIINYQTSWLQINYTGLDTSGGLGLAFDLGTVLAFYNGAVAALTIAPTDFGEDQGRLLYEIVSEAVVNNDGLYEKPGGWTGQPGSPTFPGGNPDPNLPNQLHERIHESGYMTPQGSIFTRRQFVAPGKPFTSSGYNAKKEIKIATPSPTGITLDELESTAAQTAIDSAKSRYGVT